VVNGLPVQQIAAELLRTPGAVRAQLAQLVPDDAKIQRTTQARMDWLRRRLAANPEYDWQTVLNSHADDPYRLWSGTENELLSDGWDHRTALPELVAKLQISEPTIAHHLIDLGLAGDVGEIVDRLGATPGGSVEARARHLRAELAEAIYVLVVVRAGRPITSLHHSWEEAERALRQIVEGSTTTESRPCVFRRKLDGRDTGRTGRPGFPATDPTCRAPRARGARRRCRSRRTPLYRCTHDRVTPREGQVDGEGVSPLNRRREWPGCARRAGSTQDQRRASAVTAGQDGFRVPENAPRVLRPAMQPLPAHPVAPVGTARDARALLRIPW
jgi:hypothetical protein